MSIPAVSIVIPNYNHSDYLEERMSSILSQTFSDYEIILLDDCSTDNSREVLERFRSHPKVSEIVYNDVNSGLPFAQWMKGISYAKGKYVWIAESDDSCSPEFLEKQVEVLESNDSVVLSFCRSMLVDQNGKQIGFHGFQSNLNNSFSLDGEKFVSERMVMGNIIVNASSAVFRKSCIDNIHSFFAGFRYCGDIIFWSEIARKGIVHYYHMPMNFYRQHITNQSLLGLDIKNIENNIAEQKEVLDYFLQNNDVSRFRYNRIEVEHLYSAVFFRNLSNWGGANYVKTMYNWKSLWPLVYLKRFKQKFGVRKLAKLPYYALLKTKLNFRKRMHKTDYPVIWLYSVCWNEEKMLPFMFSHYDSFVDRFIIYDNHSTDSSRDLILANKKAELREYSPEKIDDDALKDLKNQCWKDARGKADYVIVCDVDEFLYHSNMGGFIESLHNSRCSIFHPQGYEMCSEDFPVHSEGSMLTDLVKCGKRFDNYSKCVLFDPYKVVDINYSYGAHTCSPKGIVKMFEDPELKLLHYKNIGVDNVVSRFEIMCSRLSENNIEKGLGIHYQWTASQIKDNFYALLKDSVQVID